MPIPYNTPDDYDKIQEDSLESEDFSQAGKSYSDMLPYLLSGDADDIPMEFVNQIHD